MLVDKLLVVGDDGFGNGLADGVDLRGVTTARDTDADVDFGEAVEAEDQEGLVDLYLVLILLFLGRFVEEVLLFLEAYLEAQDLGLDEVEGLAVDLDEAFAFL